MTTANKVTIVRILLVPFFIVEMIQYPRTGDEMHRFLALIIFAVASITDGIDGYIARHYNQRSELGTFLDPLADKLLVISGIILLSLDNGPYFHRIPLWLTAIILSRDVLLVIGILVIHYTFGRVTVRPRVSGKVATVLQMALMLWLILHWDKDFLPWLTITAGVFTGLAGLQYLYDWFTQVSASPSSGPSSEKL